MCLFIVCIEASLVCAPFCGPAEHRAKGINHTESGRSLTGSRNITVGHASRGHGFIHTSHCLIPRLLFPRSKKRLAQPQTHRHARTHSLKHSQIGRFRRRKHSGKYFFECHLFLSHRVAKILHEPLCRVVVLLSCLCGWFAVCV